MSSGTETLFTAAEYEAAALTYYESLPLEHFMEATDQSLQREIALSSFRVLRTRQSGVRLYNELLFQWVEDGEIQRLVPDNSLFLTDEADDVSRTSFNFELETGRPLVDMEWISDSDLRKDRPGGATFAKNERIKVPYYLCFHRATQTFEVFEHNGTNYDLMPTEPNGRYRIPEIDLEIGLKERWVRFWHRGELLPLPDELAVQAAQKDELLGLQREQLAEQREAIATQQEQLTAKDDEIELLRAQLRELRGS
ncbi:MAG: hypothetical protein O3A00_21745 [Planctomycetota bacterium]|nr:hypothetical protein [Planctomycetota bacterium]